MVTSAQFQFFSGWSGIFAVNTTEKNLQGEFPTPLYVLPANPTPTVPVGLEADNSISQSWIGLAFKGSSIEINLGRGKFDAGIRCREGPPGQATAVVAPRDPGDIHGFDFFISVLAGPGKLQEILNSIIRANTEALSEFVVQHVPKIDTEHFSLKLSGLKVDRLESSFAAISKQGRKTPWNLDLVLNFSGTIRANGKALNHDYNNAEMTISNLVVQLGVAIDTTKSSDKDPQTPHVYIHRLQCAVDSMSGIPLVPYYLAGYLNSTYNKEIINALNEKIGTWLHNVKKLTSLEKYYDLTKVPKTRPSDANFQEWMSSPSIQAKQLCQLRIPGTHDSAAYTFDRKISHILYDGLDVLLNLKRDEKAPPGHKLDDKSKIYIGPAAYDSLVDNIMLMAQAHNETKTIKQQLKDGIRYLDLRIYQDRDDKDYYTQHLLRAPKLFDLINQIREFLQEHKHSQEFIIVEFAQSWFDNNISAQSSEVADRVRDAVGEWLYMPPNAPTSPESERYDFQNLSNVQLSSITNGAPKVLFVSRDSCIYPHSILNVHGPSLHSPESGGLKPRWFTKEPSDTDIVGYIFLNTFDPAAKLKILQRDAYERNADIKQYTGPDSSIWRYMMDWYTESKSNEPPVDLIIGSNF
jgi:hypothetical protein